MEYIFEYKSPIGAIIITSDETEITGLRFKGESEAEVLSDKKYKETSAIKEGKKMARLIFFGKKSGVHSCYKSDGNGISKARLEIAS